MKSLGWGEQGQVGAKGNLGRAGGPGSTLVWDPLAELSTGSWAFPYLAVEETVEDRHEETLAWWGGREKVKDRGRG